jgi:Iap family predicted aminopeptidase
MPRYEVCILVDLPEHDNVDELEYMVDISHAMVETLELDTLPKLVHYAIDHAKEDYPHSKVELEFIKEIQYVT